MLFPVGADFMRRHSHVRADAGAVEVEGEGEGVDVGVAELADGPAEERLVRVEDVAVARSVVSDVAAERAVRVVDASVQKIGVDARIDDRSVQAAGNAPAGLRVRERPLDLAVGESGVAALVDVFLVVLDVQALLVVVR